MKRLYVAVGDAGAELPPRIHLVVADQGSGRAVLRDAIEAFGGADEVNSVQSPGRVEDHLSDGYSVATMATFLDQMDSLMNPSGDSKPWHSFMAALVNHGIKIGREMKQ